MLTKQPKPCSVVHDVDIHNTLRIIRKMYSVNCHYDSEFTVLALPHFGFPTKTTKLLSKCQHSHDLVSASKPTFPVERMGDIIFLQTSSISVDGSSK